MNIYIVLDDVANLRFSLESALPVNQQAHDKLIKCIQTELIILDLCSVIALMKADTQTWVTKMCQLETQSPCMNMNN